MIFDTVNGKCICKPGYYLSDRVCKACNIFCSECTGPTSRDCVPLKCANEAYPLEGVETNCLYMCETPIGDLYIDRQNNLCRKCVSPCHSCFKGDGQSCTSCESGKVFYENSCLEECPPKTYQDSGSCFRCDQGCKNCVNNMNFCIGDCEDDFFYRYNRCIKDCGQGYVAIGKNCEPCNTGCAECTHENGAKVCLKCSPGRYLLNGTCLSTCPERFYPDNTLDQCAPCNEACVHCFGGSNRNCHACNTSLGFIMIAENTCNYPSCTDGSYFNLTLRACASCPKECSKCFGIESCTECVKGYNLDFIKRRCYDPCDKPGFTRKPNSLECEEICGDGKNMGKLECDDGNTRDNDGCSSKCEIEPFYECSGGTPSNPDTCIYRKSVEIINFRYFADRSVILTFDTRLRLLDKLEDIIEFSVTKVEDPSVKWTYETFNKNRFVSVKFKLEFGYTLTGIEVILYCRRVGVSTKVQEAGGICR